MLIWVRNECQLGAHSSHIMSPVLEGQCRTRWPVKLASRQAGSGQLDIMLPSVCQEPLNIGFSQVWIPSGWETAAPS